jgi:hypothetical protein
MNSFERRNSKGKRSCRQEVERCSSPVGPQIPGEGAQLRSVEVVGGCQPRQALAQKLVRAENVGRVQREITLQHWHARFEGRQDVTWHSHTRGVHDINHSELDLERGTCSQEQFRFLNHTRNPYKLFGACPPQKF